MNTLLWTAASAIAIGNALFFGLYLWLLEHKKGPHRLLSLLLFALAVRIGKSAVIILFPNAPDIYPALGLLGMAAIGPLAYLHIRFVFGIRPKVRDLMHFLPVAIIGISLPFASERVIFLFYSAVVGQLFIYLTFSLLVIRRHRRGFPGVQAHVTWSQLLSAGLFLISLCFMYQLFADSYFSYALATVVSAVILYVIGFLAMNKRRILTSPLTRRLDGQGELVRVARALEDLFENDKVYTRDNLTLVDAAEILKCQPYVLSKAVNEVFQQRFTSFLNGYRVKEATRRLQKDGGKFSIEAIAYESGFSTLSSFYASFKRTVKMTPAEYRNKFKSE